MTLCVIDCKQCQCQPDEGVPCDAGTPAQVQAALNAEIMKQRAAMAANHWKALTLAAIQAAESGQSIEAIRARLAALSA